MIFFNPNVFTVIKHFNVSGPIRTIINISLEKKISTKNCLQIA